MMKWSLPVDLPPKSLTLRSGDAVMLLGSCFAERIGQSFLDCKSPAMVNPWGVLYNPASIARILMLCVQDDEAAAVKVLDSSLFRDNEGLWRSWLHDTSLACLTKQEAFGRLSQVYEQSRRSLLGAQCLFITWGTNHGYYYQEQVVANCHRQPQRIFEELSLSVADIVGQWHELLGLLRLHCPHLHIVFTVSPYRYAKYGLHESALSKSTLLLAIDELQRTFEHVSYFPAYEIIIDELRDYRFYMEDLCHPTMQASEYVWQRLVDWCFDDTLIKQMQEAQHLQRAFRHRVQHVGSEAHRQFVGQLEARLVAFAQAYPFADLTMEYADIEKRKVALHLH